MTPAEPEREFSALTIATLLLAAAQMPFGSTLLAVALPSVAGGLAVDMVSVTSLLVTSYIMISLVTQGPGGRLGDLFGQQRMLWLGMGLYTAGSLLAFVAPNLTLLVIARVLASLASALTLPATMALLRIGVRVERRGRIFGLFGATLALSTALGPLVGGEILVWWSWRAVFLANLPFIALLSLSWWLQPLSLPRPAAVTRGSFLASIDLPGVFLFGLTLLLLVTLLKVDGLLRLAQASALVVVATVFILVERRARHAIFDPALFRAPAFAMGTLGMAAQNFVLYGMLYQMPQFFERWRGDTPREIGHALFAMMLGVVLAAPLGGRLCDRFGARRAGVVGGLVLGVGALAFTRLPGFASSSAALLPLFLLGIGQGLCSAPNQSAAMSTVGPERAGVAAGVVSSLRYLGGILGVLMLEAVLGDDRSVSVARHALASWTYVGAAVVACGAALFLPGRRRPAGTGGAVKLTPR